MSAERTISVELVQSWIWRCVEERILLSASDLRMTNPVSGYLNALPEDPSVTLPQDHLRHTCGSNVLAIKPRDPTWET